MGYKRRHHRSGYRKNNNKIYSISIGLGIAGILAAVFLFTNYDITVANQKIDPMIPIKTVEQKFNEFYDNVPTEKIDAAFQEITNKIPIKVEAKPEKIELLDCSKYKQEYLERNKNVRTTPDNTAAMIGDAWNSVAQTQACEKYNKQLEMKQETQGTVTSTPVSNVFLHGMMVPPWTGPDGVKHDKTPITGTFSISKIIVSEKEYYKTISLNLNIKAENLELDDFVLISPMAFTLQSQQGKSYGNQPRECSSPISYQISGKTGPNLTITTCYQVEKQYSTFDVFFLSEDHKKYKIGSFTLN